MTNLKLRITRVDLDGYNGRDHHPSKDDEGKVVTVVAMEMRYFNCETDSGVDEPVLGDDGQIYTDALPFLVVPNADLYSNADKDGWRGVQAMYTAVTTEGVVLQLMDHEVELEVGRAVCSICGSSIGCERCYGLEHRIVPSEL